jgi:flagellar biosynthesis GTPase FlhF
MTNYTTLFNQLPQRVRLEIATHLGSTAGMSEVQIATRYKDVAWWLRSVKLATLPPGYASDGIHMTPQEFNGLSSPVGVSLELAEMMNNFIASECAWYLDNFVHQLLAVITRMHEAARLQAQRQAEAAARQLAQRQAEEAARQLAQRQAEEAARLHAQHVAEEAARQLEQRQAEDAARLAARQLAEQQAQAAAAALAQQKAREAAVQEARLVLELAAAANTAPTQQAPVGAETSLTSVSTDTRSAQTIFFMPGPEAMAEIDRATLVLKHGIDAAVDRYALAISPYLNAREVAVRAAP